MAEFTIDQIRAFLKSELEENLTAAIRERLAADEDFAATVEFHRNIMMREQIQSATKTAFERYHNRRRLKMVLVTVLVVLLAGLAWWFFGGRGEEAGRIGQSLEKNDTTTQSFVLNEGKKPFKTSEPANKNSDTPPTNTTNQHDSPNQTVTSRDVKKGYSVDLRKLKIEALKAYQDTKVPPFIVVAIGVFLTDQNFTPTKIQSYLGEGRDSGSFPKNIYNYTVWTELFNEKIPLLTKEKLQEIVRSNQLDKLNLQSTELIEYLRGKQWGISEKDISTIPTKRDALEELKTKIRLKSCPETKSIGTAVEGCKELIKKRNDLIAELDFLEILK